MGQLLDSLQVRNHALTTAQVLAAHSIPWSTARLALIARGAVQGDFQGRFEDELFGIFIVDSTLTRVIRVVDAIPTPRWHDYDVHFDAANPDSLYVVGEGATYGDQPLRRSYDWSEP